MNRARLVTAVICMGLGGYLAWQGTRLKLEGFFGPGPGFFPFWIGCAILVLGALWSVQIVRSEPSVEAFLPPRERRATMAIVIGGLLGFMLLLRPIGFDLAMLSLLLVLFFAIDRSHPGAKIVIAVAGSFGVHWLFENMLRVPLPGAQIEALSRLGF